jgi:catechol 2,3-dioxygenase-like lactoylglutathione lyase family enzyme
MAKIRHVAVMVKDAKTLKEFYEQAFGFEQCYGPSASNSYMVIDGTFNIALLQVRQGKSEITGTHRADGGEADQRLGINHFGFVVDDVDQTVQAVGAELKHGENPQDGRPAEMRVFDPWGNGFDLSARGYFGREEVRLPAVRHLAVQTDKPGEMAAFYGSKVGLHAAGSDPDGTVCLTDGLIHCSFVPRGRTEKKGVQYYGIQVDSWEATAARFKAMGVPFTPPADPDGEVEMRDPEGNLLVLSQRGWG